MHRTGYHGHDIQTVLCALDTVLAPGASVPRV
jgi:hypothetical protein